VAKPEKEPPVKIKYIVKKVPVYIPVCKKVKKVKHLKPPPIKKPKLGKAPWKMPIPLPPPKMLVKPPKFGPPIPPPVKEPALISLLNKKMMEKQSRERIIAEAYANQNTYDFGSSSDDEWYAHAAQSGSVGAPYSRFSLPVHGSCYSYFYWTPDTLRQMNPHLKDIGLPYVVNKGYYSNFVPFAPCAYV